MTPQKLLMIHRNPPSLLPRSWLLSLFALGCFALCPVAQAVVPAPDGGYPGGNTAEGTNALFSLTTGVYNTALGLNALFHVTDGDFNTATGAGALFFNNGDRNTAHGINALRFNTAGDSNTAVGTNALYSNTGSQNTAVGDSALFRNTTGGANTAIGISALNINTTGGGNTAVGTFALDENITGSFNTAVGRHALANSTSTGDTALGYFAGSSLTTGGGNVVIGRSVPGVAGASNQTWIRNINTTVQSFIAGTNNYVTVRMTDGRLGFTAIVSSRRYKEDIKPMEKASEAIHALKPVTFRLKDEVDTAQLPGFGLIAEDVEEVNPDLVYHNAKGQPESVRYEAVNAMLLNEFLKEHKKVEAQNRRIQEQEATITQLKKEMQVFAASLKEQAAQIQKVSAQLELNKTAPRTVLNK
jgi:trimeric autotransporter adhesin